MGPGKNVFNWVGKFFCCLCQISGKFAPKIPNFSIFYLQVKNNLIGLVKKYPVQSRDNPFLLLKLGQGPSLICTLYLSELLSTFDPISPPQGIGGSKNRKKRKHFSGKNC